MEQYIIVSIIVFLIFGIIWKSNNLINTVIKILLIIFAIWGIIEYILYAGYVIRI
jgi:hypothetical protein